MKGNDMIAEPLLSLERDVIMPSIEIGAFEALWANGVSSFKQLRDKLALSTIWCIHKAFRWLAHVSHLMKGLNEQNE